MDNKIVEFVEKMSMSKLFAHLYHEQGLNLAPKDMQIVDSKHIYITHEDSNIITLMNYEEAPSTPFVV